ncbi:haloacid dehalogenase type II [Streptomyces sp. NPDC023327]|uniref:haloacid dehalogenase type II n=1 Tax=Streptomyces sp. NPDC023327 TaxID=3157088 RepID=UPI003402AC59
MTGIQDIEADGIEVVVFDVLGTLVDELSGLRAGIREAAPWCDEASLDELTAVWQEHAAREQESVMQGDRAYAGSGTIDREAARRVADRAGVTDAAAVDRLATVGQRLSPWEDSVAALERLAQWYPVLGLSNADRTALLRLSAHAGLRWHQALSAEAVQAYKPAPEVYRLAVDTAGCPPERILMVAAHAWDLRGAQTAGLRTAYVGRPGGDPPERSDVFDWQGEELDELVTALAPKQR